MKLETIKLTNVKLLRSFYSRKRNSMFLILFFISLWSCTNSDPTKTKTITIIGENSSNMYALQATAKEYIATSNDSLIFNLLPYEDTLESIENYITQQERVNDIAFLYNFAFPEIINPHLVYDLDSLIQSEPKEKLAFREDIFPKAWEESGSYFHTVNGNQNKPTKINYPVSFNTMVLVYNKEMFANENYKNLYKQKYKKPLEVPTNWQDYYTVAEFFTNSKEHTYGVTMQGAGDGYLYYEYCSFLFGMNGKVFDKTSGWQGNINTPIIIDNTQGLEATMFYKSLKPFNNGDFINVDGLQQRKYMKEGKTAMAIVWSDFLRFYAFNDHDVLDDRFGYTTIPGKISGLEAAYLWVNKKSQNPINAAKYVLYCLQKENQINLVKKGFCSPQQSVYDAPELANIPYLNAIKNSLQRGTYVFEYGPDVNVVSQAITNNIQKLWLNEISPKQALEKIKQEITLKRAATYK